MKQITHDTNIELMYKCWAQYIYINSMIVGLGDPKETFRDSLAVCVLLSSVQKMHWEEKMQFGGSVVVDGD